VTTVPAEDAEERRAFYIEFTKEYDRFQKLAKQDGTYIRGLIKRAELSEDHRIHTQLNLHGTNSGRLSSSKPNLQNITRPKDGLPDIRRLFKASDGCQIVQADFSQAELRCIAQFSGDGELTRIYSQDLSLHRETATRFYGPDYTTEQYATCKNVNFGVFYGQSAETFQEKHGIPVSQARPYIEWVWKTFKGVAEWEDDVRREIKSKGVVSIYLPEVTSKQLSEKESTFILSLQLQILLCAQQLLSEMQSMGLRPELAFSYTTPSSLMSETTMLKITEPL
jgi:DNA polymerase I-like protein with 3'-5' exonuclease and polymerase domains